MSFKEILKGKQAARDQALIDSQRKSEELVVAAQIDIDKSIQQKNETFRIANELLKQDPRYQRLVAVLHDPLIHEAAETIWNSWNVTQESQKNSHGFFSFAKNISRVRAPFNPVVKLPEVTETELLTRSSTFEEVVYHSEGIGRFAKTDFSKPIGIEEHLIITKYPPDNDERYRSHDKKLRYEFTQEELMGSVDEALKTGGSIILEGGKHRELVSHTSTNGDYGDSVSYTLEPFINRFILIVNTTTDTGEPRFHLGYRTVSGHYYDDYKYNIAESLRSFQRRKEEARYGHYDSMDKLLFHLADKLVANPSIRDEVMENEPLLYNHRFPRRQTYIY